MTRTENAQLPLKEIYFVVRTKNFFIILVLQK